MKLESTITLLRRKSKQWIAKDKPAPTKTKMVPSAEKLMATGFWNNHEIRIIDYLQKDKTIMGVVKIITYKLKLKLKAKIAKNNRI